jgi:hypothetical protein
MAHGHCTLDNYGHKHSLRICNTYCFSTTTVVARTRLNITLHVVHCPSLCILFSTVVLVKDKFKLNLTSNHNVNGTMCGVHAIYTHKLRNYLRLFSATCNECRHDSDSEAFTVRYEGEIMGRRKPRPDCRILPRLMCWHAASHSVTNISHFLYVN